MISPFAVRISSAQDQVIRIKIASLLYDQIAQPFRILREAGVVAELRSLLLSAQIFNHAIAAHVSTRAARSPGSARIVHIASVQMEITALPSPNQQPAPYPKTLDIAILRDGCSLTCERNGPGDIIQQVAAQDLVAAIEVKASPSNDLAAGGTYVHDIESLLRLARSEGIKGYFVLLDKSSDMYRPGGRPASPPDANQLPRWMQDRPDAFHYEPNRKQGCRKRVFGNLKQKNITLSGSPAPSGMPTIEVWTIEWDVALSAWAPLCRFAY